MQALQSEPIRLLLIDNHALFRAGLVALAERYDAVTVVADCGSASDACQLAAAERPDVVLLDLDIGSGPQEGLDLLSELLKTAPETAILIVTAATDRSLHQAAVLQGARGILTKDKPPELLLKAIERVHAGETWLDRAAIGGLLHSMRQAVSSSSGPAAALTERERQIIALLCEGMHNREIGRHLNIAEKTVRNHLSSVFSKVGVSDRLGLAIFAFRHGLVSAPGLGSSTERS